MAAHKAEVEALLEKRGALEQVGGAGNASRSNAQLFCMPFLLPALTSGGFPIKRSICLPCRHVSPHPSAAPAVQEFMEAYLATCEAYENELERLRGEGVAEHAALKRRWASWWLQGLWL